MSFLHKDPYSRFRWQLWLHHARPSLQLPLCSIIPILSLCVPFSTHEGTVAYEIYKSAGCYVALGARAIAREVEPLEKVLNELNLDADRKIWDQSTKMITIGMEDKTFQRLHQILRGEDTYTLKSLDHAVSRMITDGDPEYVENFIHTSPEADLLVL